MARYMLCALLATVSLMFQGTAAAGPTPSTTLPDIVAEVNGQKISSRDYYNRLERMPVAHPARCTGGSGHDGAARPDQ